VWWWWKFFNIEGKWDIVLIWSEGHGWKYIFIIKAEVNDLVFIDRMTGWRDDGLDDGYNWRKLVLIFSGGQIHFLLFLLDTLVYCCIVGMDCLGLSKTGSLIRPLVNLIYSYELHIGISHSNEGCKPFHESRIWASQLLPMLNVFFTVL
jgi:hypothetical protein